MSIASQPLAVARINFTTRLHDLSELVKARVTTMIMITAWCGFYFGAHKSDASAISWTLLHAVLGIGMVSAGSAAMNEVVERDTDALMRRTSIRPLVTHHVGVMQGTVLSLALMFGGALYLTLVTNLLTASLALLTAAVYLLAYTPLKKVGPICTFVGAFPGAMPGLLGWTAARGRVEVEGVILFAIVFVWQFPHFHSIALLYREDYERAGIKMLPVVESDGRSTARAIMFYGAMLLPISFFPAIVGMAGLVYLVGAAALGLGLYWYCVRVWREALPASSPHAKVLARGLLKASVIYLPLLFALMTLNSTR